jgi:hypothetical protein
MKKYFALILILSCCSPGIKRADLNNPDINDYTFSYFEGVLGNIKAACKINSIEFDDDSVFVSGRVYDKLTLEGFPETVCTVWVGKYIEKTDWAGDKQTELLKEEWLMYTGDNGNFSVKFKLKKDDCLIIGTIGYDPVVIRIYDYVKDFY